MSARKTYAILGATGTVGGSILAALANDEGINVRCFVRSGEKLYDQRPELKTNERITVIEGSIESDVEALAKCIAPASVVFSCTAVASNVPGCSIALDSAHSLVSAVVHNKLITKIDDTPHIIVLSSSTIDKHLSRDVDPSFHWILRKGLGNIYDDLEKAEAYYRLHRSWLRVTCPGGLTDQPSVGYELTVDPIPTSFLPNGDLASAFVELAQRSDQVMDWRNVSVLPKGKTRFEPDSLRALSQGWLYTLVPRSHTALRYIGLA